MVVLEYVVYTRLTYNRTCVSHVKILSDILGNVSGHVNTADFSLLSLSDFPLHM